jgi:hypothetical protein
MESELEAKAWDLRLLCAKVNHETCEFGLPDWGWALEAARQQIEARDSLRTAPAPPEERTRILGHASPDSDFVVVKREEWDILQRIVKAGRNWQADSKDNALEDLSFELTALQWCRDPSSTKEESLDELQDRDDALRSAVPEGKVLVDSGELKALRATIAKLKEFRDPVNVAKRIEEYAAQHKPAQREVVPNGTGWWFMEGDQGQRTTTAANASQHPGQGGNGGDHA